MIFIMATCAFTLLNKDLTLLAALSLSVIFSIYADIMMLGKVLM